MDTRHLEAFRAVYENGSVSAAAIVLQKSQPAVSKLISRLEDEIGLRLFHRTNGRLEVTPEATIFLNTVSRTIEAMEQTHIVSRNLKGLSLATLSIASPPGLATHVLPHVVANVLSRNHGATARFITRTSASVRELGRIGAFDVGFAELPIDDSVASLEVFESLCVCVLRPDHPLSKESTITPDMLHSRPFIALSPEHSTYIALREMFSRAELHWNILAEVEFSNTACMITLETGAATIVDPSTARLFASLGLVTIPFLPSVPYRFGMFRPNLRPASRIAIDFMDEFRKVIKEYAPS